MGKTFRFWLVYCIAWLPFIASYLGLLVAHLGRPWPEAIRAAIIAVLPPALLGIGVVAICNRFLWRPQGRIGFFSVHLLLAVFYFLLWMVGAKSLAALDQKIEYGSSRDIRISESSFEVSFVTSFLIYTIIAGAVYGMQSAEKLHAERLRLAELESSKMELQPSHSSPNDGSAQWITRLFVKDSQGRIVHLRVSDVVRLIGADDYVEVFANNTPYLVKLTLSEFERRLDPQHFRRIHRSAIINLDRLISCREVDRRLIVKLSDGSEVTASRSGSQSLRELVV
jgi:LytTr DNA-binding domain